MKTALLLSGWPRFHAEFDEQLSNLHGSDIDWIVVLWKNFPADVETTLNSALTPSYVDTVNNEDDARAWLRARMPESHNLVHFSYVDWNDFPMELVRDSYSNQVPGTNPEAIFRQFWMLNQVNTARHNYGQYDLVIRSRGDVAVYNPIQLDKVYQALQAESNRLLVPSNNRQGLAWNDLFTVGMPAAIDIYADAYKHFNDFYDRGVTMHPENIVSHVIKSHGLYWGDEGVIANIRQLGKYLTPTFVRGQKYYQADFGRW